MATRVQSSPFRETEWDQKLDRMLDDLKSTVHTDDEDRRTPLAVRSSSRSSSRAGSTGRRAGSIGAGDSGVSDHGRLTHHRKEYTSPDQSVRTVADTYQYDSGDAHPSSNFQKKVVKSTYSSYNVDGGLSAELESLKRGPTDMEMERALSQESRNILNANYNISTDGTPYTPNNKVVDASQDVARELVGALSCIGSDSDIEEQTRHPQLPSSQSVHRQQQQQQQQMTTVVKQQVVSSSSSQRIGSQSSSMLQQQHHQQEPFEPLPHYQQQQPSDPQSHHQTAAETSNVLRIEEVDGHVVGTKPGNGNTDYSTLGRLKKNINELGNMIDGMDQEEMDRLNKRYLVNVDTIQEDVDTRADHLVDQRVDHLVDHRMDDQVTGDEDNTNACTDIVIRDCSRDGHPLSNGHPDDDVVINDEKGGEVRRIVWRNRYEKTYETADSSGPTVSIEKDARSRRYNTSSNNEATTITSLTRPHVPPQRTSLSQSPKQLTLQYAVYWPGGPNISPGGQSWAEPVPLPTPPQVSPKEPGVAYIYNYGGSGGSAVQPLPPLNYVSVAPPAGGVIDGGAPSPTPSAATTSGQPVIYHYSYHYTIQPGQTLPEGAHPPSSPPALQIVPPPATGYSTSANLSTSSVNNKSSRITEVHSNTSNRDVHHHHTATKTIIDRSRDREPLDPNYPSDDGGKPRYPDDGGKPRYPNDGSKPPGPGSVNYTSINSSSYRNETHHHPFPTMPNEKSPRDPDHPPPSTTTITYDSRDHDGHPHPPHHHTPNDPNRNIMININKTTTHTTHTTSNRDGSDGQYPPNDNQSPLTSTPYRGRSRSPERRYPAEPRYPSGPSDSLERVRRPHQHGLPFPETSPVKGHDDNRIPRKVDELMTDFPVKNGGPHRAGYPGHPDSEPLLSGSNQSRQNRSTELHLLPAERNEINTVSPSRMREERDKTKNQSGPPVYYPPGHEEFSESMHTMTLKEGGRRGKAKWRKEAASGYQESSSHSESKGGVKMVPVCLPLCCGAACTIM